MDEATSLYHHRAVIQSHRSSVGEGDVDAQCLAHLSSLRQLCGEKKGIPWATGLISAASLPLSFVDHQRLIT